MGDHGTGVFDTDPWHTGEDCLARRVDVDEAALDIVVADGEAPFDLSKFL